MRNGVRDFAPWRVVAREAIWATAAGLLSVALAVVALGIDLTRLRERWQTNYADDQLQHYMVATAVTDSPVLGPNSRLGFPNMQNLFFAPNYDPASLLVLQFESLFTSDGVLILNLYYLFGFFATAFAGFLFFRALRVRRITSSVFALIFALAPYHFIRVGFGHAFVADYWAVALVGILILMVASERSNPFEGWIQAASTRSMRLWRRLLPIGVITLLVSLSLSYYFVFGALIMGIFLIVRLLTALVEREGLPSLRWPAATVGALAFFVIAQLAILSLDLGDRYTRFFSMRSPAESEDHAGKITSLLLPWTGSGFTPLASISKEYAEQSIVSIYAEPPGTPIIAMIGMILVVLYVLARLLRPAAGAATTALGRFARDDRISAMSAAFIWALLFYVVGGLGVIFALVVSSEVRAWTRLSIILILLALGFLAVLVDLLAPRLVVLLPILGLIVVIATVDQLAGVRGIVNLDPTEDVSARAFVADAENLLDTDCGVVQLPLKEYPTSGIVGDMSDYAEALPYVLATDNSLRWSYGAVRGTHSGDYWATITTAAEFETAVEESAACAVYVDTFAYTAEPDAWRPFVDAVADSDDPAIVSTDADHRYLLFEVSGS